MKSFGTFLCCLALTAALASCKSGDSAPAEGEPDAGATDESAQAEAPAPAEAAAAPAEPEGIPAPDDVAAPPEDAEKTKSGLASKVIKEGDGKEHPSATDLATVHYTGWTTDGKMFDSSVARGETIQFPLNGVIPGWTEGVQLMVPGETRRLWIPEALAYGGAPGKPAGMLVFDVELISVMERPKPPETPKDVAKVPKNAKKTKSGLASRVLKKGTGKEHPSPTSIVKLHFTGWTPDGQMFESSVSRGQPAQFPVNQVSIEGWKEGLQLMVVGEKRRVWVPGDLAFGEPSPSDPPGGPPKGMLVFDFELLDIQN